MVNVNLDEPFSLRPERPRGPGGMRWLIRVVGISAHLAMAWVAWTWIYAEETPPKGVKATAQPRPITPPAPVVPPKKTTVWSPTPIATTPIPNVEPTKASGTGRPSLQTARVGNSGANSRSIDKNRQRSENAADQARTRESKSPKKGRNSPDAAEARLREQEAGDRLEARGIKRGDSGAILSSEGVATSCLLALRSRAFELNQAMVRLATIQQVLAELREIDQTVINLNNEITQLGAAMAKYPAVWSRGQWFHGYNNIQNGEFEAFKAQKLQDESDRGELNRRRDSLRLDQPGRQQGEATQDLKRRRGEAVTALAELQSAIASIRSGYANLRNDPETTRALSDLKLGPPEPSPEFLQVERECKEFERSAVQLKLTSRP